MTKLILICIYGLLFSYSSLAKSPFTHYLLKPTGQYAVAFKDLHLVNHNSCPDLNSSKANQDDFSPENKKHCHEIMLRIYYPSNSKAHYDTPYYLPIINTELNTLKTLPAIKSVDLKQIGSLKSNANEEQPIVQDTQFPVVLFISGLGGQIQFYENVITQLVSHGYIVIGINSVFINGDIILPNKKVVSTIGVQNWNVVNEKTIPQLEQDISFVYEKIREPRFNPLFKSMDLKHIGAWGHSFGGRAMANVVKRHEKWFQAMLTFDMEVHMGSYQSKNLTVPTLHIISAYWRTFFNWLPLQYQLNKNGYLVTLTPSLENIHYSYHMNFTDLSTFQYLPAYQILLKKKDAQLTLGEDVIVTRQEDKTILMKHSSKPLYLITKNKNSWNIWYYSPGKKRTPIDIELIAGLQKALDSLPSTELASVDLFPIKKIIHAYHQGFGNFLGRGDGIQITEALNLYVVDFFNAFLKNKPNPFRSCTPLTQNTLISCGPGIF